MPYNSHDIMAFNSTSKRTSSTPMGSTLDGGISGKYVGAVEKDNKIYAAP